MALLVSLLVLVQLAMALALVWDHGRWKRRLEEMQRRLDDSLDDQDLLEFESKIRALLQEVKGSGGGMIQAITRREEALLKALEKVKEAERRLHSRSQEMEKAADQVSRRLEAARSGRALPPSRARSGKRPSAKVAQEDVVPPAEVVGLPTGVEKPLESKADYMPRPFPALAPGVPNGPSRHQKLYDLADQGVSRDEICRTTGMLQGEVELILNLRPAARRRPK